MTYETFEALLGQPPAEYAADGWSMGRLRADLRARGQDPAQADECAAHLELLGLPMWLGAELDTITLTTANSASSYNRPVLVVDGVAYGPDDLVAGTGWLGADLVREWAARYAGPVDKQGKN